MMHRVVSILTTLILVNLPIYSIESRVLKSLPRNFEFEASNITLIIRGTDSDVMSFESQLPEDKKLSCIEHRGTFRVRALYKTEGVLYLNVPKNHLFEQIRITTSLSNVIMSDIQTVNLVLAITMGDVTIQNCKFKISNLIHNSGNLEFNANILRSSAICVNNVIGNILFIGKEKNYHIDYGQGDSIIKFNGQKIIPLQGIKGNEKSKQRAIISAGQSKLDISFSEKV